MTGTTLPESFEVKLLVDSADLKYLEIYEDFRIAAQEGDEDTWRVTAKDRDFNVRLDIVTLPSHALAKLACSLLSECAGYYHAADAREVAA